MEKTDDIAREVDTIVDALRVNLATAAEALTFRADALAELALSDPEALQHAVRATAVTCIYAELSKKIDLVVNNPEQAEAVVAELEKLEDDGGCEPI